MDSDSSSGPNKDAKKRKKYMYKMRKYRASLGKEDRERIQEYDRDRKALKASQMSEEEKLKKREKDKQRKALSRAKEREREGKEKNAHLTGYGWEEKEKNRQYKIRIRKERTNEEIRYDNIKDLIRKREIRKNRSKEEQTKDKVKAKDGMRQARYQGYIMDESTRSKTKFKDVERIWRCFWDLSDAAKQILKAKEPEIAEKLEDEDKREPDIAIRFEDEDKAREAEMKQIYLARIKAWRKKKRVELRKALDEPIIMPEVEKSEYEKVRDENVKQLEEARLAIFSDM